MSSRLEPPGATLFGTNFYAAEQIPFTDNAQELSLSAYNWDRADVLTSKDALADEFVKSHADKVTDVVTIGASATIYDVAKLLFDKHWAGEFTMKASDIMATNEQINYSACEQGVP